MAVNASATRVYLLRASNYDTARLNLAVLSLDGNGTVTNTKLIGDGQTLAGGGHTIGQAMLLDELDQKLFLLTKDVSLADVTSVAKLVTYGLDVNGDVIGGSPALVSTVTGNDGLSAMPFYLAHHPTAAMLYIAGGGGVWASTLNPITKLPTFPATHDLNFKNSSNEKSEVAASATKLYLGAYATSTPRLEVLNLDGNGNMGTKAGGTVPGTGTYEITEDGQTPFACKAMGSCICSSPLYKYTFQYTPKALYRRPRQGSDGLPADYTVGVLPLDGSGLPVSSKEIVPVVSGAQLHSSAQAPDPARNVLWLADDTVVQDVFSGTSGMVGVQPDSWTLGSSGVPTAASYTSPVALQAIAQAGTRMAVASSSGRVVLLTEVKSCLANNGVVNQQKGLYLQLAVSYPLNPGAGVQVPLPANQTNAINVSLSGVDVAGVTPATSNALSTDATGQVKSNNCLSLDSVKKYIGGLPLLQNRIDDVAVTVAVNGGLAWKVISPTYTMKFFSNAACTGNPNATITSTIDKGGQAAIVVPGYAIGSLGAPGDVTRFKSLQTKTNDYRATSVRVGSYLPDGLLRMPSQFTIGCGPTSGFQGSAVELSNELQTSRNLGCNTTNFSHFEPMDAAAIQATINDPNNIISLFAHRRAWAEPYPVLSLYPGCENLDYAMMDFELYHNGNYPGSDTYCADQWANAKANDFSSSQGDPTPIDIKYFALIDEPGWKFPASFTRAPSQWSRATTRFQNHIAQYSGLDATAFGGSNPSDWSSVQMAGHEQVTTDLRVARRYYWTMDFLQDALTRGAEWLREAWERKLGGYPVVYADLSNYDIWFDGSYKLSPTSEVDSLTPDWKRLNSVLDGFAEIAGWGQNDRDVDRYEYQAALLQSSLSMAPPSGLVIPPSRPARTIGAIIHGQDLGYHPWGVAYTTLSLIGHGAKTLEYYAFGPYPLMLDDNGWSDNTKVYLPIARANDLIAAAEAAGPNIFFAGKPPIAGQTNGNPVAIVLPTTSYLWNPSIPPPPAGPPTYYYTWEARGLYLALAHQAIGADFLDQKEITAAKLNQYKVVYVVGPNLPSAVTQILAAWVHDRQGVLALTPGAIVSDEYNQHDATIENIFGGGARSDTAARSATLAGGPGSSGRNGRQLNNSISSPVCGPDSALFPSQALGTNMEQNYGIGGPTTGATLSKVYGNGKIYFYSYFPGFSYLSSPDRTSMTRLPTNWDAGLRSSVAIPTTFAGVKRAVTVTLQGQVTELGGVEPLLLQAGANGDAVVLLNWTDIPITNVTVTVANAKQFNKSATLVLGNQIGEGLGLAGVVVNGTDLQFQIPWLGNVDVLVIK